MTAIGAIEPSRVASPSACCCPHLRHSPTAARPSQIKSTFRMSRSAAAGSHAAGTTGRAPEGVLAVVCLDDPRDNTRGKALWTSLLSLGP